MCPKKVSAKNTGEKKKRMMSMDIKHEIVDKHERGVRVTDLAKEYDRSTSTICTILKQKDLIKAMTPTKGIKIISKLRTSVHEEMEKLLLGWLTEKQLAGDTVTETIICEKARVIYLDLVRQTTRSSSDEALEESFKASRGWFDNFKKRTGVHSVVKHGEAASSDFKAAEEFTLFFGELVEAKGFIPQQVLNCDETGLFWKKIPKRTYITAEEKSVPGHKPMKDRLTLALCANTSGDLKIKPLLVYHSESLCQSPSPPTAFSSHLEVSNEIKSQSSNYNSVSNQDDGDFQQMDNFNPESITPYSHLPTVVDSLNINDVGSTEFRNLSQEEEEHEQQQQLSPQPQSSIQTKLTLGKNPLQPVDVGKDIYIVPNTTTIISNSLITENISLLNCSDRTNIHQFHQKSGEELGETDRTQDSGVISIDDCDMLESKDVIAAQIELMQPSHFLNNESCQTRNGDKEKNINASLLPDIEISNTVSYNSSISIKTNNITKSTDGEIDSIAEYFKICDNSTRQTFLDVMRNDREQHALALDSMSSELKSVTSLLHDVQEKQQRKKDRIEELLTGVNQLQADYVLLEQQNSELTEHEAQLQDKLKQYSKKVTLCDSALNAMTNGKELHTSIK